MKQHKLHSVLMITVHFYAILNTVEYIVICFIISHFPLLLLCIVPWSWCGWMDVHFIDWWSFDYEVTCQSFDQSQGFLHEMKHII